MTTEMITQVPKCQVCSDSTGGDCGRHHAASAGYDWEKQTQIVQDERAKSFEAFQRAVGRCSLTPYQAEADMEIEERIKAVVHERDLLLKALRGLVGVETREELDQMEAVIRATVGPASDKAAILDAIDALRTVTR